VFCIQCGSEIADDSAFCMTCGQRVEEAPGGVAVSPLVPVATTPKKSRAGLWVALGIIGALPCGRD
jgi:Double zinc ribbon